MNVKLEQRIIMQFRWSEGTYPVEIHSRLLRAFQEDAYTLLSVSRLIGAFKTVHTNVLDKYRTGQPRLDYIDSKMLPLFHGDELYGVQTLAQELGV
jgi:hypothetical protein